MSMEPSWVVTCDPGWSMEEAAAGWSSDDRISFQTSLPSHIDSVQPQVVEYACPATATHDTCSETVQVLKEEVAEVHDYHLRIMPVKMHKFPPSLVDVHTRYTVPLTVAIGPYHRGLPGMMEAEQMKNVAADQCLRYSTGTIQDMYNAVSLVSSDARHLYYQDELAIFGHHDDFVPMMFLDACFLVQFMRWYQVRRQDMDDEEDMDEEEDMDDEEDMDPVLSNYFYGNLERISTDIMMLENQIPWMVVQAILDFLRPVPSTSPSPCPRPLWEKFVFAMRIGLKNQLGYEDSQAIDIDPNYEPPHLLGLVRFYIVGKYKDRRYASLLVHRGDKPISLSISVAELADVGITLVPRTEAEVDMRLHRSKWGFFGDLFVPPLCLTVANATSVVNMAALELCTTPDFTYVGAENSAVCSYLHLFTMLLDQERHVQDLRENKVIEGGGLTSKETLQFFTSIGKNMRLGTSYLEIIIQIDKFKRRRSFFLKAYLFLKKNRNKILAVLTALGAAAGILSAILSLKTNKRNT